MASNVVRIPFGFRSGSVNANGTTLHYVRGGTGPAVILLYVFPEDRYEFHLITPRLAKTFTVVAVHLRGGANPRRHREGTMRQSSGGHSPTAAQLRWQQVYVVGHDIGGMVAYAFVSRYPQTARGAIVLDYTARG